MEEKLKSCGIQIPLTPQNKLTRNYLCKTEACEHQFFDIYIDRVEIERMYKEVVGFTKEINSSAFISNDGLWIVLCPRCDHYYWTHANELVDAELLKEIGLWNKPVKHLK
jgi:hypothetical protein